MKAPEVKFTLARLLKNTGLVEGTETTRTEKTTVVVPPGAIGAKDIPDVGSAAGAATPLTVTEPGTKTVPAGMASENTTLFTVWAPLLVITVV
ncbi:hypothetical protein D3C75_712230 [compost metagenome]